MDAVQQIPSQSVRILRAHPITLPVNTLEAAGGVGELLGELLDSQGEPLLSATFNRALYETHPALFHYPYSAKPQLVRALDPSNLLEKNILTVVLADALRTHHGLSALDHVSLTGIVEREGAGKYDPRRALPTANIFYRPDQKLGEYLDKYFPLAERKFTFSYKGFVGTVQEESN